MLCGDLSVAEVEWIVQYQIGDPKKFLFNVRDPKKLIRDALGVWTALVVKRRGCVFLELLLPRGGHHAGV